MQKININDGWAFGPGPLDLASRLHRRFGERTVDLPHDYMIESDVYEDAPSKEASGFYNATVAHYAKEIEIPADWEGETIVLRSDGIMMNATIEVNGSLAGLQHYGYAPFEMDVTRLVYPGEKNCVVVTVNPSMQPNSRWYSGAGMFRGIELAHGPKLRVAFGGLSGHTHKIEYRPDGSAETAYLKVSAQIRNDFAEPRMAEVSFDLVDEATGQVVKSSKIPTQIAGLSEGTAYMTLTVDDPRLWSAEDPQLYVLRATVKDIGVFKTHYIPNETPTQDSDCVLFGIRTVEADVKHGLRINGKTVKLRGGCLHHDNGLIGVVSLYDAEARKVRKLKSIGFNAIRTTHNPPSAALIEACDRLGMYVFDEAFDAWAMGKQPGDYNQYFATDWEKDLTAFVKRDRCHPSVIIWSTGNEITERGGLGDGYMWAVKLAEKVRALDGSRPVSNGVCSFWNGLDDFVMAQQIKKRMEEMAGNMQNADIGGKKDLLWEQYTEAYTNGMDVVGYNYLEGKYEQDHEMFPERVILGSENYPKEIGIHWPMIEATPYVIGDFTWTAWDYIGEAGIGKSVFYEPGDSRIGVPWGIPSPYPWRTANDADFDVTGAVRPQGVYRRIVWGSEETAVFSYDPAVSGKVETLTSWGFPGVAPRWNWSGQEGQPVDLLVFSRADEVELFVNGESLGRKKAGEAIVHEMPQTFLFRAVYQPGTVEAVSYTDGREVSRAKLETTGAPASIRLTVDMGVENAAAGAAIGGACEASEATAVLRSDSASLLYVKAELLDAEGRLVQDADLGLTAQVEGRAVLLGFGSGNPITEENYTKGSFTIYQGQAMAVLRGLGAESASDAADEVTLTVCAEGLAPAKIKIAVK